jgi:hypothetical protein
MRATFPINIVMALKNKIMKRNWLNIIKYHLLCLYKGSLQIEAVNAFIPGIYEGIYPHESENLKDIITIRRLSEVSDVFWVERRVLRGSVEGNGSVTSLAETEQWISALHHSTRQLVCGTEYRVFSFLPEKRGMYFEDKEYIKTAGLNFVPGYK